MLPIEQFTTRLIEKPPPDSHLHAHLTLPPTVPNSTQNNAHQLPNWLATLLDGQGIKQLSDYQWHALQLIAQHANVCVSAPAGSGRGTTRLLALHHVLHYAQQKHALYICLLKQGELKQLKRIMSWNDVLTSEHHLRACIYDGDTPKTQRRKIKQTPPHVLLTTPEMLHAGILAYHGGWRAFLQSLQMIILPDIHLATNAIGVHLAHMLRRLHRLCRHYGSQPQFLMTTAPLGNLPQLTRNLTGQVCTIVAGETRRESPQTRIVLNVTGDIRIVTDDLISRLNKAGLTPDILLPNDQPMTEPKPEAQSVVFLGLPLSLIALHEYMARFSSHPNPGLGILVLSGRTPLERYVLRYPDLYQHTWLVDLPLYFNHPLFARQHLVCAAAELPLQAGERYAGLSGLGDMIKQLSKEHAISRKPATRQWVATQFQPHRRMRLRFFEPAFAIIRQPGRRFLTSLEPQRAFREAFEGAIYRYQGESFLIERYLEAQRRIIVRSVQDGAQTEAQTEAQIDKRQTNISQSTPTYRVAYGTLIYTECIRTFERLMKQNPAHISRYALPNHQRQFCTEGVWFDVDGNETTIHTFIHAVLASVRLIVACRDSEYEGVICEDSAVILDLQNGGNGIGACLYQARDRVLRAALQILLQCDCEKGCKRCISGQHCNSCKNTVALDRQAGIKLLQKMVGEVAPPLDAMTSLSANAELYR